MSDDDKLSRTEEPTETKIRDALEKGNVPVSREAGMLAGLIATLAATWPLVPRATSAISTFLAALLDTSSTMRIEDAVDARALMILVGAACAACLLPILATFAVTGVLASVAQAPLRFAASRIKPDASRLSLTKGLGRLVGAKGVVEFSKSVAKVIGLGAIAALVLRADASKLIDAMRADPRALPGQALVVAAHLLTALSLAMGAVVALDIVWTRRRWRADLRMTRHDVKEEMRQAEGDPLVKARLRSIRLDRARRRMMAGVPRATLVVTNPTHFAIALRYRREEGGAPIVVAKGQDLLALRIRELARDHGIPIVENKPLARALYDQAPVDSMIPPEFYRAVAEILNLLTRRKVGALA